MKCSILADGGCPFHIFFGVILRILKLAFNLLMDISYSSIGLSSDSFYFLHTNCSERVLTGNITCDPVPTAHCGDPAPQPQEQPNAVPAEQGRRDTLQHRLGSSEDNPRANIWST